MHSHILNMLVTALIISTTMHAIFFDKRRHPWHHHFFLYFGILFVGGLVLAWGMYLSEPAGYYPGG